MPLYLGRNKIAGGSAAITIDDVLNSTSENPVQNKVIKAAIDSIVVPTKVSDLTNDSGFTTNTGTITGVSANGTSIATNGEANIPAASTSVYGVTKLSSSINSTSTEEAATASAVKSAYDLANTANATANAALPKSGGTMTGVLTAQNNTSYTTKQARNIFLIAEGENIPSGSNGDICLVYAP